jgi:UDP-N-acetylmuramoylalanine--D-glutamate ligase
VTSQLSSLRRFLILGYGREGASTHHYLLTQLRDPVITIADQDATIAPTLPYNRLYAGSRYLDSLQARYDMIVRTPGISLQLDPLLAATRDGAVVTSQTKLFLATAPGRVVGVTGTKGKSTTASLIAEMLRIAFDDVRLVGNIGRPMLDSLPTASAESIFVAELSSYQLEDVDQSPPIAVLLGLYPEHLDRHGSVAAYFDAKANIFRWQKPVDILVYDADNRDTQALVADAVSARRPFSLRGPQGGAFMRDGAIYLAFGTEHVRVMSVAELRQPGLGMIRNTLAAAIAAANLGVTTDAIRQAASAFAGLPHRIEYLGQRNGVDYYDDSIATIPEATINAIEALGPRVETLIAGGFDRGLSYDELGKYLATHDHVTNLLLFPPAGRRIAQAVAASGRSDMAIEEIDSMAVAVALAVVKTHTGRICILSPAAPSFGLFRDFEERGDQFRDLLGLVATSGSQKMSAAPLTPQTPS